jgi:hypothetical protein
MTTVFLGQIREKLLLRIDTREVQLLLRKGRGEKAAASSD